MRCSSPSQASPLTAPGHGVCACVFWAPWWEGAAPALQVFTAQRGRQVVKTQLMMLPSGAAQDASSVSTSLPGDPSPRLSPAQINSAVFFLKPVPPLHSSGLPGTPITTYTRVNFSLFPISYASCTTFSHLCLYTHHHHSRVLGELWPQCPPCLLQDSWRKLHV